MKIDIASMFQVSILVTVMMIFISAVLYLSEKEKRHLHILEFWMAYGFYFTVSSLTQDHGPKIVALSSIVWIWRTRAIRLILSDVCGIDLFRRWHLYVFGTGYLLAYTAAQVTDNFTLFTLPAAVANFIVGSHYIIKCWIYNYRFPTPAHKILLTTTAVIFLHILDYPFVRYNHDWTAFGFAVVLVSTVILSVLLPAVAILDLQRSHQEELQKIIQERGKQLEDQSKLSALGAMTAGIAHEIISPLSLILHRSYYLKTQIEQNNFQKDQLIQSLDLIQGSSERMSKIIKALRNFTRESKNLTLEVVSVKQLVEETVLYCQDRLHLSSVKLIIDPYPNETVECSPVQISQVLLNLLNNSFEAVVGSTDPWIHISFEKAEKAINIVVSDSGRGIPEEIKDKMMDPFFTTKGATGLGLSIARDMVEEHKGRLFYKEGLPHTAFVLELPYRQSHLLNVV